MTAGAICHEELIATKSTKPTKIGAEMLSRNVVRPPAEGGPAWCRMLEYKP
jgi:hypothetical protein